MMKKKFLKVAQDGHFFDKHKKILVAVSGGKDSMALLDCLLATRDELQLEIGIAHVNHKQRKESDEEEAHLKSFAQQENIPIYTANYQDSVFSEKKARDFRYQFFEKKMREHAYTGLVTAHHADDQAETIFMRLLRGSRLRHLSGIQAIQNFGPGQLIRPLLSFKKSELEATFYFEDSSNKENTYLRNRIRNNYLPLLEKENPQFSHYLLDLGQENAQLFQALQDLTKDINTTSVPIFRKQSPAVQVFLLQDYLATFPDLQVSKAQFKEILTILQTKTNYYHPLNHHYCLIKDYNQFEIFKILPETDENEREYVIESEGIFEFGGIIFSLNRDLPNANQVLWVDKHQPIRLRYRKAGDTILLNGIQKKLRRYFIDQKVPAKKRQEAIIIEQHKTILGVANQVTSDLSKSVKNDIMKTKLYIKTKE